MYVSLITALAPRSGGSSWTITIILTSFTGSCVICYRSGVTIHGFQPVKPPLTGRGPENGHARPYQGPPETVPATATAVSVSEKRPAINVKYLQFSLYTRTYNCLDCELVTSVFERTTPFPGPASTAARRTQRALSIGTPLVTSGRLRPGSGVLRQLFGPTFFALGPSGGGGNRPDRDRDAVTDEAAEAAEAVTGGTITELLVEQSVLTEEGRRDGLRLAGEFRSDWRRRIERVGDEDRALMQLAMLVGADPTEVQLEVREDRFVARYGGREIGAWPSRAAFLADIALYPTIEEWLSAWSDLDGEGRAELLARLRAFLERCPGCEGKLRTKEARNGRSDHVAVSITCRSCRQVIVTGSY